MTPYKDCFSFNILLSLLVISFNLYFLAMLSFITTRGGKSKEHRISMYNFLTQLCLMRTFSPNVRFTKKKASKHKAWIAVQIRLKLHKNTHKYVYRIQIKSNLLKAFSKYIIFTKSSKSTKSSNYKIIKSVFSLRNTKTVLHVHVTTLGWPRSVTTIVLKSP